MPETTLKVLFSAASMFFVVIIGYIIRKVGFTDEAFSKKTSRLITCVASPFMIISAINGVEYSPESLKTGFTITLISFAVHFIFAILAIAFIAPLKSFDEKKITHFGFVFANCAFFGFPILDTVFGDKGRFYGAFYILAFNMLVWSLGLFILARRRSDIKINIWKVLFNWGSVPCIIGVVLYVLKPVFALPDFVMTSMDYMGNLCTPLSLIVTGGLIATIPAKKLFTNLSVYYVSIIKAFVIPIIIVCLCKLVGIDDIYIMIVGVMASMPIAANTSLFGEMFDVAPSFAGHIVGMTTLIAPLCVPIMLEIINMLCK